MNFQGQTILITGGAQGIGKSIVQSFLSLNAKVMALDIDPIEKHSLIIKKTLSQ